MIHTLKVTKALHPVELTYDGEGLRIEGDFNAHKKVKPRFACGCIPLPPGPQGSDPTLLPIPNTHLLQVFYNDKTHMIQIHAIIPESFDQAQSPVDLYKFMYTVEKDQEQSCLAFCTAVMDGAYKDIVTKKRLKILINPFGGQGRAKEIYDSQVRPIFEAAKCVMDIQYTEYQGHAIDIAKQVDLEAYDAMVMVSGDGVTHEVINGLLSRPDGRQAIRQLALGVIPGGTANALSISILGEQRGLDPIFAAVQVIKGRPLALDLCSVTYDDHHYFSFLSQNYGSVSYADLGTEHLRWMGDARMVLGFLKQIISGQTYGMEAAIDIAIPSKEAIQQHYDTAHASATWININENDDTITIPALTDPVPDEWTKIDGKISFFLASKTPYIVRGALSHPCALPNDGFLDLLLVRGNQGVLNQLTVFDKVDKGAHLDSKIVEYYKIKAFRLTPKPSPGQDAFVAIDGEHAPLKPFQVQVHPRLASVLSLQPTFITTHFD